MCKTTKNILIIFILLLVYPFYNYGQIASVDEITSKFDQYSQYTLQEKMYLHTDRSAYLAGEILWFKAYYVDGTLHQPLDISKVAYVEVIDNSQRPVLQTKIALDAGNGKGSFFLPASLSSGSYRLRAYTNWMKNFNTDYFFEKPITIVNTFKQLGLQAAKDSIAYEIQFFPEGGNLVQNISSKVAFRATDRYGKGIDFQGILLSHTNDTILKFQPQKFGMGHFSFTPVAQKEYKALIKLANGKLITQMLPAVASEGYTMALQESGTDQLTITIKAKISTGGPFFVYLFAHTRQMIKVAEKQNLQQDEATFTINKKLLGDGISHITIFNANSQPVCERLYFKMPEQKLIIEAKPDQNRYSTRKKVSLEVFSSNNAGSPLAADLSVAVYKVDSLQTEGEFTLPSYLWLTSDLAGKVESAPYYFSSSSPNIHQEIDNVMLTHGWRKFQWQQILQKDVPAFRFMPEYEGYLIQGRVLNIRDSKPAKNIDAYLSVPGRFPQFYVSPSNSNGEIQFVLKPIYGSKQVITQTNSRKDSLYRIELSSPYSQKFSSKEIPYFKVSEQFKDQLLARSIGMQVQNTYFADTRNRYFSPFRDTTAFYGVADATYNLDEYTRFPLMEDVLKEYVPGVQARKRRGKYHLEVLDLPHKINFSDNPLVLVDGVPVFDMDRVMTFNPLKVKRLEVLNRKYYFGPSSYSGLLSLSTYTGEIKSLPLDPAAIILDFEGLQQQREFYTPIYETLQQAENRLADFRNLLYWSPSLKTELKGRVSLQFYTSDLEGAYILVLEGLTNNGEAGYTTAYFTVQNAIK